MSKVLIVKNDKYFLSQDNFYPNPFKEISSPFGYDFDKFSINTHAFLFYLERYAKDEWKPFLEYSSEFKNFKGEHFCGVFCQGKIPELKYISVQEVKTESGNIERYCQIDNNVNESDIYNVTSYPFLFIRCSQVFVPDRINFSRVLKSGGRDYAFISWDALPLTPQKNIKEELL